jgi:hypothetical protein
LVRCGAAGLNPRVGGGAGCRGLAATTVTAAAQQQRIRRACHAAG